MNQNKYKNLYEFIWIHNSKIRQNNLKYYVEFNDDDKQWLSFKQYLKIIEIIRIFHDEHFECTNENNWKIRIQNLLNNDFEYQNYVDINFDIDD